VVNASEVLQQILDGVHGPLPEFARDWFPVGPSTDDAFLIGLQRRAMIVGTPNQAMEALASALMADDRLRIPDEGAKEGLMLDSGSSAVEVNATTMARSILATSYSIAYLQGVDLTSPEFNDLAHSSLYNIYRARRSEPVMALDVVGLAGFTIRDAKLIDTPWGRLRSLSESPPAPLSPFQVAASAVLLRPRSQAVKFVSKGEHTPAEWRDPWAEPQQDAAYFMFATALASEVDAPSAASLRWITTFDGVSLSRQTMFEANALDRWPRPASAQAVSDWSTLVAERQSNLQVSMGRILMATTSRVHPEDRLIDAVTCWENMFGTRQETAFRVTSSIAILLESGVADRRSLWERLRKCYDLRSRIVHGSQADTPTVEAQAQFATVIALRCLRRLYELGGQWLTVTSEERSKRVTLGGLA
jgi:hypothetical protein